MALSEVEPPQAPLWGTCGSTHLHLRSLKWPVAALFYWNSDIDQSEGLFRGLSSNHGYMALSEVEPPQAPYENIFFLNFIFITSYLDSAFFAEGAPGEVQLQTRPCIHGSN